MIKRTIERKVLELIKHFPVIILTGARQVGKTTLLQILRKKSLMNKQYECLTLDNPMLRDEAKRDPLLFLQRHPAPIIIDEIQYAPELLPYIKMIVDEKRLNQEDSNGLYIFTGSQVFKMMKDVSESLAGRIGILKLYGLSSSEIEGKEELPFLPILDHIMKRNNNKYSNVEAVYERIFRGSFPELYKNLDLSTNDFFSSYVQTYLERDIRDLINIKDELKFIRFLSTIASRTGRELIYAELANANEIDIKTAQSWLSILIISGLVILLQPYNNSVSKRIIKRPKLYFMDTGLACYLAKFSDAKTLEVSSMDGAIFETYVISEIIKSYENNGKQFNAYYYRDTDQNEIDLLIVENGKIYPLEIKKSSNPSINSIKSFKKLERFNLEINEGGVICMSNDIISLDKKNNIIPLKCI